MTDAPPGAAPPAEDNLVFLRILATATDLAILSTSILVVGFLVGLVSGIIRGAPLDYFLSLPIGILFVLVFIPPISPFVLAACCVMASGVIYFNPGCRLVGLSVKSADGADLSIIRLVWRLVLKYLWLLLGILVIHPINFSPIHEGDAVPMFFSTTALPIFVGGIVLWWVGGSGRSVYDLATGTVIVQTRPIDTVRLGWTWLIAGIPAVLLALIVIYHAVPPVGIPWEVKEWEVDSWIERETLRRNLRHTENLTNLSLTVLGLTALTYAVFGWRHRPGRRSSPGDAALSRRDEPVDGQVQPMSDSPTGTESPDSGSLVLRRILATVTNLAMVSTSILVGAILFILIGQLIEEAQSYDRNQSIPIASFVVFTVSLILLVSCAPYIDLFVRNILSNSGCRMLGLSVKSADGGDLSLIRYLWRMVLKYLWVLLGVLVCLPPFMRPVSEGLALLASTPGLLILLAGLVLWWVGGSGRAVYDLGAGTVVVPSHPVDHARLRKTWLILAIPVILQIAALYYTFVLGQGLGFPWDIREYRVSARDVWRNKPFAEELTEYSLAVLVLTGISYMVSGRRHLPGRKASNGGPNAAARDEAVEGEGGGIL